MAPYHYYFRYGFNDTENETMAFSGNLEQKQSGTEKKFVKAIGYLKKVSQLSHINLLNRVCTLSGIYNEIWLPNYARLQKLYQRT